MDLKIYGLDDLILTAIKSEVEAKKVYDTLADRVKNALLKDRLKFLSGEEEKHRLFFEDLFRNQFPQRNLVLPEKSPVPLPEITPEDLDRPIPEILAKAMDAEKAAHEFYLGLVPRFEHDTEIQHHLLYIASMELTHYRILEIEKENAEKFDAYDEEWPMTHIGP